MSRVSLDTPRLIRDPAGLSIDDAMRGVHTSAHVRCVSPTESVISARKQRFQNVGVGTQLHPSSHSEIALRSVLKRSRSSYKQISGTAAPLHQNHVLAARPDRVLDAASAMSAVSTMSSSMPRSSLWMQRTEHQSSTGRTTNNHNRFGRPSALCVKDRLPKMEPGNGSNHRCH